MKSQQIFWIHSASLQPANHQWLTKSKMEGDNLGKQAGRVVSFLWIIELFFCLFF